MDLTANEVREVRFGTTRMRAGYDMSEVDAFLDRVERAIGSYSDGYQRCQDEAEALRSQVKQMQIRVEALVAELEEARSSLPPDPTSGEQTTVIVETTTQPPPDLESTAENPVVAPDEVGRSESDRSLDDLRKIRDDVRSMLEKQIELVDSVNVPEASN